MSLKFDLPDLQAFCAVAQCGSFRAAALTLHVSQPALSRRIDKLESALGVRLFDRSTRRVSLSTVGRDFARKSQGLLDDLDNLLLGLQDVAATRSGEVKIACVHSAAWHFLPGVMAQFAQTYPRIRLRVLDGSANEVLTHVSLGNADFGLNFMGRQEAGIQFEPILRERFVLVMPQDHALAKRRKLSWAELSGQPMLGLDRNSGNRLLLDLALAHTQDRPKTFHEAQHVQTLLGMVEAGLGLATVPQLALAKGSNAKLVTVPLINPVVARELGLITRQGQTLSPAAKSLAGMLKRVRFPVKR